MQKSDKKHILLIDDDQQLREVISMALDGAGYDCSEAQDGKEGMDILMAGQPVDLIVTDHQMPRMTGLELVKWVRAHSSFSRTPVLLYSGQLDSHLSQQAHEAGSTAVLAKPFLLPDLLILVTQLMALSRNSLS